MNEVGWQIREMQRTDLFAVVALEQACGLSSWGIAGYEHELTNSAAILLTASLQQQFAGYFSGRVMADEFELFSIAVLPEFRRQGIGLKLLKSGLNELHQRGIYRCFLEVRAANISAQILYRQCGFVPMGRRRNYYYDPVDDAVMMALDAIPDGLS